MRAIAFACLVLASSAHADPVFRYQSDWIRLKPAQCKNEKALGVMPAQLRETFFAATASVGGQLYEACWRFMGTTVHLVYDDGDQGLVNRGDFKEEPGV